MSMLGSKDNETRSYLEIVDALRQHGAAPKADMEALWRRLVFNILISNTDDHLRNHGFLYAGQEGWRLSPAYDLNPVPTDIKPRILSDGDQRGRQHGFSRPGTGGRGVFRSRRRKGPRNRGTGRQGRSRSGATKPRGTASANRKSTAWRRRLSMRILSWRAHRRGWISWTYLRR